MRSEPARLGGISLDFAGVPPTWDENLSAIYCDDETLFGPTEAPNWPANFGQVSQED